eukprot:TRINITY_DN36759_c0_g1_i1.p1 TRINITY_DN36759_c0_g1~~TRINITY_DN36759_c0_g1_i1.p1  ORF type:complete len:873 (-),score=248.21 TRINITY_DN36759_c0_g1_i1:242-2860(-)
MAAPTPYFQKKGEVYELQKLLRAAAADKDHQKKRDAIKKVIAYMTIGIDVSPLFSDMVMASATNDLVQKKMVYLYLVNYAESNAELAILAVNTLQKDCRDDDPMIRGLALRSLCSLQLANMVEYLQPAVQKALEDINSYVRKTGVMGAAKLYKLSESSVSDTDILPRLKSLMFDNDPHVVANTINALDTILAAEGGLQPTRDMLANLLNRISNFSEWGQVTVLRFITRYQVGGEGEMFDVMNILDSLLKHSSCSVVLSVTKIFMDLTSNRPELQRDVLGRIKGPLLTLMANATPELAYTVLVHIHALCAQNWSNASLFCPEFKQFYCRYNDPSYIKGIKIDLLTELADGENSESIVTELSEYVTDVDAEISRTAVRAIGKIAVRLPFTAEAIMTSLTGLLELDIDYVSTEAAVVLKDIVRKYPDLFQRASGVVTRCIRIVSEPQGKCAVLWILGEYGALIEDAPYLLEPMVDGFLEEADSSVRMEMLTAAVKLFFCRPPEMQHMLGRLMDKAITETTHPHIRDRALMYYRLLQASPDEAHRVICAPKEVVEEFREEKHKEQAQRIMEEFNTLSVVYRQPASKFIDLKFSGQICGPTRMVPPPVPEGEANGHDSMNGTTTAAASNGLLGGGGDMLGGDMLGGGGGGGSLLDPDFSSSPAPTSAPAPAAVDLLFGEDPAPAPVRSAAPVSAPAPASDNLLGDLLGGDLLGDSSPSVPAGGGGGGGLLDASPMSMPSPLAASPLAAAGPAPFALSPNGQMDGGAFEANWVQLGDGVVQQRQMRPMPMAPFATAPVETALRQRGIFVIASGVVPPGNSMRFFFSACEASSQAAILLELVMTQGGAAQGTVKVKGGNPTMPTAFFGVIWEALGAYVM